MPAGFEKKVNGVEMVCKLLVGMQGRIDATRLFNDKLFGLFKNNYMTRSIWDPQLLVYHNGPLAASCASLTEVLRRGCSLRSAGIQVWPVSHLALLQDKSCLLWLSSPSLLT